MDTTEIARLRRFSLSAALLLLVWTIAGVTVAAEPRIAPLGLPLQIARPDLIPLGLAIVAAYGAFRYFYYAIAFGPSPYRRRRDILNRLHFRKGRAFESPKMYWGSEEFEAGVWNSDRAVATALAADIKSAFPHVFRMRPSAAVVAEPGMNEDGDEYTSYNLRVQIPVACRIAAGVRDLDYAAPVWFPVGVTAVWLVRTTVAG